jgi:hypothetical protein
MRVIGLIRSFGIHAYPNWQRVPAGQLTTGPEVYNAAPLIDAKSRNDKRRFWVPTLACSKHLNSDLEASIVFALAIYFRVSVPFFIETWRLS